MLHHVKEVYARESVAILRALGSATRVRILELLAHREMNIGELSAALGLTQPSVTKHIQILEEAGIVKSDYVAAPQGIQKICRRVFERLLVNLDPVAAETDGVAESEVPVGMYTDIHVQPTCGLATREGFVGLVDSSIAFFLPERAHAQIIWSAGGWVEYSFPNTLPLNVKIKELDLLLEVASEAPAYRNDYPSDISVWVNGIKVGTWTCPGDFGGTRGHLNPSWYPDNMNQWGVLKTWHVDSSGSFVDGDRVSDVKVEDLSVRPWEVAKIRIGNDPTSANLGGFTLFGRGFGNYEVDLVLRLKHEPSEPDAFSQSFHRP